MRPYPHNRSLEQSGLSLIELMIAMAVGMVLIAGVLSVFLSSRKSYGINNAVGQIQENGRMALNFIRVNTRMAGYMGCGTSGNLLANQLTASGGSWTLPYDFGNAITGFEYTDTAPLDNYTLAAALPTAVPTSWAPQLSSSIQTAATKPYRALPGSDVFAVSISQGTTTPSYISGPPAAGAPADSFTITANNNDLAQNDLLVISNCASTAVRQATLVAHTAAAGGSSVNIVAAANAGTPGNTGTLPAGLTQHAQVTIASVVAYYIGLSDAGPALYEAVTDTSQATGFRPEEIAPGVENMQVLYGVDPTGNGQNPIRYLTAEQVAATNWNDVVSVRVALLLQSAPGAVAIPASAQKYDLLGAVITAPRDTRLRQVFTATIGLRNRIQRP